MLFVTDALLPDLVTAAILSVDESPESTILAVGVKCMILRDIQKGDFCVQVEYSNRVVKKKKDRESVREHQSIKKNKDGGSGGHCTTERQIQTKRRGACTNENGLV